MSRIYADYAATAPMCQPAKEKIVSLLDTYGNPSSVHADGQLARDLLDTARCQVAEVIGAEPEDIFFTSGGTEANNLALAQLRSVWASPIEHPSILNNPRAHTGGIKVDHHAVIQPLTVDFACLMLVNNEVGTVQPVKELSIGDESHEGVTRLLHVDAVQAVGHIPVDVKELRTDMLSLSAHKFGGPKGVGALYINRKRINVDFLSPLLCGGGQEHGVRSGTENVLGIAAMGEAIEWARENMEEHRYHTQPLRDKLIDGIVAIRGVELTGHPTNRVPGIASFIFKDVEGHALLGALDEDGISVSSGSACSAGRLKPSHVLLAMGYDPEQAEGALRLSIGWKTTEEDVEYIIKCVRKRVRELRGR